VTSAFLVILHIAIPVVTLKLLTTMNPDKTKAQKVDARMETVEKP